MTNTMTNEILSMNELDRVSGGTNRECKELKKAIRTFKVSSEPESARKVKLSSG